MAAGLDGALVGGGADDEGEGSDDGHVPGPVTFSRARLVLLEDDVEGPVETVLDGPVTEHDGGGALGVPGGGGDEVAGVIAPLVLELGAGLDADDGGHAREAQFAGKSSLTPQPVDLADHARGALLDAAMGHCQSKRTRPSISRLVR